MLLPVINRSCVCYSLSLTRKVAAVLHSRQTSSVPDSVMEKHRKSKLNFMRVDENDEIKPDAPKRFRDVYPEFLPSTVLYRRDHILEKLQRRDMLKRRAVINIPEFYVGSIMAVTISEEDAPGMKHRFVGICTERGGNGLRAWMTLRNHVQGQGVEITYELYSPIILEIETLKLEKRLDDSLAYLKDAPAEYSTIPFDYPKKAHPPGKAVPVNDTIVKMNRYPWFTRWELHYYKGMDYSESGLPSDRQKLIDHPENRKPWQKYDLMKWYRESIDDHTAADVMRDVQSGLQTIEEKLEEQEDDSFYW